MRRASRPLMAARAGGPRQCARSSTAPGMVVGQVSRPCWRLAAIVLRLVSAIDLHESLLSQPRGYGCLKAVRGAAARGAVRPHRVQLTRRAALARWTRN